MEETWSSGHFCPLPFAVNAMLNLPNTAISKRGDDCGDDLTLHVYIGAIVDVITRIFGTYQS